MKELTPDLLQEFSRSYAQKDGAQTLHMTLYKTDMADLSYVPLKGEALKGAFSVEVKTRGITAQEQSGRCWLFAAGSEPAYSGPPCFPHRGTGWVYEGA